MVLDILIKHSACILLLSLIAPFCLSQPAREASRTSNIDVRLAKKEIKVFVVNGDSLDDIAIQIKSNRPINLSVKDPDGFVREGKMLLGNRYEWLEFGNQAGAWEITLENLVSFASAKISMKLTLTKDSFVFGSGKSVPTALLTPRNVEEITDGTFRIKKASPVSFPVGALKGDTILVDIIPQSGRCPQSSISNDGGEWLHASKAARTEKIITIPVFEDGETIIELEGASFLRVFASPFKQVFEIKIDKISPLRYTSDTESIDTNFLPVVDDTLAEVYLDTIIQLGAVRNILNPSQQVINIAFRDPESILCWGILYGSGKNFFAQLNDLIENPKIDPTSGKSIDIIERIINDDTESIPKNSNRQIQFLPSEDIASALAGKNFGRVDYFNDVSSVKLVNKSKSIGQEIYVRVVSFRAASD